MATAAIAPVISESGTYLPKQSEDPFWITSPPAPTPAEPIMEMEVLIPAATAFAGRPETVLLGTVADRRLRVRKPIPLAVSVEEGHIIVSWDEADEFAYGMSTGDAVAEFSKTISELYFDLNDQSVPLGKDLARVRDILNAHIEKTR